MPLKVTAGASFNDAGHTSSDLTNLGFGITETVDWPQDVPVFLYVANRQDTEVDGTDGHSAFFIARSFAMADTPAATDDIGDTASIPVNDSQNVILLLGAYTKANYVSLPCQVIGSFRMRWLASAHDWTIQPFNSAGDGIGPDELQKQFSNTWTMPPGQNGSAPGNFLKDSGGTAPSFGSVSARYRIHLDGTCTYNLDMDQDGGTPGGGGTTYAPLPYEGGYGLAIFGTGRVYYGSLGRGIIADAIGDSMIFILYDSSLVANANFTDGPRTIKATVTYTVF